MKKNSQTNPKTTSPAPGDPGARFTPRQERLRQQIGWRVYDTLLQRPEPGFGAKFHAQEQTCAHVCADLNARQ